MTLLHQIPWKRLIKIAKPFWISEQRNEGLKFLAYVLGFMALQFVALYLINKMVGLFMTAFEQKKIFEFCVSTACYLILLAINTPLQAQYDYNKTVLALTWRKWLTLEHMAKYFKDHVFAKLSPDIDNPEQRIGQDIDSFCNSVVGLLITIIQASGKVLVFSFVLWSITPRLFWFVMTYATIGLLIVSARGKLMPKVDEKRLKQEADLRTAIGSARDPVFVANSTEAAIAQLHQESVNKLSSVIDTLLMLAGLNRHVHMFTIGFNMLPQVIPVLITAQLYFSGQIEFGVVSQAVMAFLHVFEGATVLIAQYNGISAFTAITNRIGSLLEEAEAIMEASKPIPRSKALVCIPKEELDHGNTE
jgi:ABC-type uncharacterized transport system fused permease/ATPase subunit